MIRRGNLSELTRRLSSFFCVGGLVILFGDELSPAANLAAANFLLHAKAVNAAALNLVPGQLLETLAAMGHDLLLLTEMVAAVVFLAARVSARRFHGCICCSIIASGGAILVVGWAMESVGLFFFGMVLLYSGRLTSCFAELTRQLRVLARRKRGMDDCGDNA